MILISKTFKGTNSSLMEVAVPPLNDIALWMNEIGLKGFKVLGITVFIDRPGVQIEVGHVLVEVEVEKLP